MGAGIRFALCGIQLEKQLQPLRSKGRGGRTSLIPEEGNKSPTASKLIVTGRAQGLKQSLSNTEGRHSPMKGHSTARDSSSVPSHAQPPRKDTKQHGVMMHTPLCVCLSVRRCRRRAARGGRWEQHPRRISCGRRGREKSHCQEERGSLSVSSAAHERWIYHGFPFPPCFIWQFIILSAGTGQLLRHTPSLTNPCRSHRQDPGEMPTWTT